MARAPKLGPIRFVADFDHVAVLRTVSYRAGQVVDRPSEDLIAAAGDRAEPFVPDSATEPAADGE